MNQTGTYAVIDGKVEKISDAVPNLSASVYFNKGSVARYDPSARMTFESKEHKRLWLKENGMKEGGIIKNTDKRWDGPTKNATKYRPTGEQKRLKKLREDYIQSQGGTLGLIDKFSKQGGK